MPLLNREGNITEGELAKIPETRQVSTVSSLVEGDAYSLLSFSKVQEQDLCCLGKGLVFFLVQSNILSFSHNRDFSLRVYADLWQSYRFSA